jgi:hypothetical protein
VQELAKRVLQACGLRGGGGGRAPVWRLHLVLSYILTCYFLGLD